MCLRKQAEGEFKDSFRISDMNNHVNNDDVIYCTKEHQGGEWEVTISMLLANRKPRLNLLYIL